MDIYGVPAPNLNTNLSGATVERRKAQQGRRKLEFIRGPIPVSWAAAACRQGRLAVSAGLLLWFRAGCSHTRESITVPTRYYEMFGLRRESFARGLQQLEVARLVVVDRARGRKPRVTIRDVAPAPQ